MPTFFGWMGKFSVRGIFHGEGSFWGVSFPGKFYNRVICQNSDTNLFLLVLLSLCQLNITCGDVKGKCPGGISYQVGAV